MAAGIVHDDTEYEGAQSDSLLSLDYYRQKARDFQALMNSVDQARAAAVDALAIGVDPATDDYLQQWLAEFENKRFWLRGIAEGINLGAEVVNAAGGRMPVLSVPQGLGILPALAMSAASIAAFGAVAAAITWGAQFVSGLNDRLKTAQLLDAQATPEQRAALAAQVARVEAAQHSFTGSGLAALAPLLKWGAIIFGGYLVLKHVVPLLKR